MLITLPISTDFSNGSLNGWFGDTTPTVGTVTGEVFTGAVQSTNRDCNSLGMASMGGLQIKVSGWLNTLGLAGHPSDGQAWTASLGVTCYDSGGNPNWVTSAALTIQAGNGWTYVSDTLTTSATCVTIAAWFQIGCNYGTIAPHFAQAALLSYLPLPGGFNLVGLPSDVYPGVTHVSSIEWDSQEAVSSNASPFTGQTQVYDWQTSWLEGHLNFPPMRRYDADMWTAFIRNLRGVSNAFMIGDPKAALPKGAAIGAPVVNGAGQTGYSLLTRGWAASVISLLLPGDYIQIGYRMYSVTAAVNSSATGAAIIPIWPNLRDVPADGTVIVTRGCKGLFQLKKNNGNKNSVNPGNYGFTGLDIREAI